MIISLLIPLYRICRAPLFCNRRLLLAAFVVAVFPVLFASNTARAVPGGGAEPKFDSTFWKHWGDGQAELAGYEIIVPRYGELRSGTGVLIFVTETFSNKLKVKADPGRHPKSDEFPVLKLNLMQDFPTGIYDYNLMTSVFIALSPVNGRPAGSAAKISFSSQEWCGQIFSHFKFNAETADYVLHSYFDGEADLQETLAVPASLLAEDSLFHWARGLAYPVLAPGESRSISVIPSLQFSRLEHQKPALAPAVLTRLDQTERIRVPGGEFETYRVKAEIAGGRNWEFWIESEVPQRIVRWQASGGYSGALLKSARLKYWEMQAGSFREAVAELGLTARGPAAP